MDKTIYEKLGLNEEKVLVTLDQFTKRHEVHVGENFITSSGERLEVIYIIKGDSFKQAVNYDEEKLMGFTKDPKYSKEHITFLEEVVACKKKAEGLICFVTTNKKIKEECTLYLDTFYKLIEEKKLKNYTTIIRTLKDYGSIVFSLEGLLLGACCYWVVYSIILFFLYNLK